MHTYSGLTVMSFSQLLVGSFSTITQTRSKTVHMWRTRSTIFHLFALFVMSVHKVQMQRNKLAILTEFPFSALTLLAGRQEGHPASKK